jgi:cellulose synthase/poly-beta-1,6-N-acetylglucosamine synthase-like glycosyltransferase
MINMNSVSIVIPTYNSGATIKDCLESIEKQTKPPEEIIIVDGHSTDSTIDIAKQFKCRILFEEGGTRAAACNVGVPEAKGDYVVFIDADAIAKEDWLENLISAFEEDHGREVVCTTGPNIEYPNESIFGKAVSAVYNTFIGGNWSEYIRSIFDRDSRYVQSAAGCNAAYKRIKLEEIMPINENFITAEDTEINYKLIQKGYSIYFEPNAVVYHQRPQTHKAYRNKAKKYARGKIQFFRAHRAGLDLGHILPPLYFITGIFFLLALLANYWLALGIAGYFGAYLLIILLVSFIQTIRYKKWQFLYLLPIMFFEGHVWWSLGIIQEIFLPKQKKESK